MCIRDRHRTIATKPIRPPAFAMSFVFTIPVLVAMALGGVDIGSIIEKLTMTPMSTMTDARGKSGPIIPETPNPVASGMSRVAVTVLETRLAILYAAAPNMITIPMGPSVSQAIRLISHSANPVFFRLIPIEMPPATSQSTSQEYFLISAWLSMPSAGNNVIGKNAITLDEIP